MSIMLPIHIPKEIILQKRKSQRSGLIKPKHTHNGRKTRQFSARRALFNTPLAIMLTMLLLLTQSASILGGVNIAMGRNINLGLSRVTQAASLDGYQQRFKQTARGQIVFTGNALGLNTFNNIGANSINGSIDVYSTTDTSLQVPGFPSGTTKEWRQNASMAVADVPDNSLILYAELIWGANYKNISNVINIKNDINSPVSFITPTGASQVTPDPATASETDYGYVRTANVTDLIKAGGGQYTVGGVPGILDPLDKSSNYAGWTLAVVYSKASLPIRNLSFYTGSESVFTNRQNGNTVEVTGFGTPLQGSFQGKLWVSAQEGDSDLKGDQLLFGSDAGNLQPISGPNNAVDNFFAGQINGTEGSLDTRGTFGIRNQTAGTSQGGRRHGFDITAVDVTSRMTNGQTKAFIKGTSSGDIYVINGLGFQIDVNAPNPLITIVRDKDFVRVGETIKYDISITNDGIIDGKNPVLHSLIPEGTKLIPGTFKANNIDSNLDPATPITIADIAPGATQTYSYSVRVDSLPASGVFENEAYVDYEYTPVAGSAVVKEKTYSSKVVTFPLIPIGLPPVALDDTADTLPNTAVTLPVVANDTDPDGNLSVPTLFIKTPPTNGKATVDLLTGTSTYIPNADYIGTDTYVYNICDTEGLCDDATVTINIRQKTPPVAADDTATTKKGVPVIIPITSNDTDPINTLITNSQIKITTLPIHGDVIIDPITLKATYTPKNATYVGTDVFDYEICNKDGCDPATVTVTIGDIIVPDAVNDTATTKQNTAVDMPLLTNDTPGIGANFDLLTLQIIPESQPAHGTITLTPNSPTGTIKYTPAFGYTGNDSFKYKICNDQQECDIATATITINEVAGPKPLDDIAVTQESKPIKIPALINDLPGDSPLVPSTTTITTPATNGTTAVNPSNGDITYTPKSGFRGRENFVYTICDQNNKCAPATVIITVAPLTPPTAKDDTAATNEATPIVIPIQINDLPGDAPLVPNSTSILSQPANGTTSVNPTSGAVTYTPKAGFSGRDTFVYQICDQNTKCASANVTVIVNQKLPPIANPDTANTLKNEPVEVPILENDVDPLGTIGPANFSKITAKPVSGNALFNTATGRILYTPNQDYVGSDTFTYEICNADGCSNTVVSVNVSTPEKPDALDDVTSTPQGVTVSIPIITNDVAGVGRTLNPATLAITTPPVSGTALIDPASNQIKYTPKPGFTGTDTLSYQICNDAGVCDSANVLITVTPPPLPNALEDAATTPINQSVLIPILTNDQLPTGTDPASVSFILEPTHGKITYNPTQGVTYTPNPGYTGEDRFVYKICTPYGTCDSAEVKVNVTPLTISTIIKPKGQVLGVKELTQTLPRTGGRDNQAINAFLMVGLLAAMGFFTSLYFIKSKNY